MTVETTTLFDIEKTTFSYGVKDSYYNDSAWQDHRLFGRRNFNSTWAKALNGNRDASGKVGTRRQNKMR